MMTKEEKEHKIKLIYLIVLVNAEYARRKPFKNAWETIAFTAEQVMWAYELKRVASQRTLSKRPNTSSTLECFTKSEKK